MGKLEPSRGLTKIVGEQSTAKPSSGEVLNRSAGMITKIDFIIGGAQKCGTSALARYLEQHPDIYIPDAEIHYFDILAEKYGLEWYLRQFKKGEGKVVGEKTPRYIRFPEVAQCIKKYFPDIKMIFLLRDPVDRAYSHYWHMRRQGLEFRPFDVAITQSRLFGLLDGPDYLKRGMYVDQLKHWYGEFDRDQILVLKAEDLKESAQRILDHVFAFIGVSPGVKVLTPPVHVGTVPRNAFHYVLLLPVNAMKHLNNYRICALQRILFRTNRFLLKFNRQGYPKMREKTRSKLESFFSPYNNELKALTGVGWDYESR